MNYTEFDQKPSGNAGFPVGLVGGLVMIFTSLAIFFMNGAETKGDLLVWFIQLVAYIFLGSIAANRQAETQRHTFEPSRGISGAGVGAPLTTSLIMWIFIIVRNIIRDSMGIFVFFEPFSFCGWIIIDVLLALGIGNITGRSVLKQYNPNPYDTSNF